MVIGWSCMLRPTLSFSIVLGGSVDVVTKQKSAEQEHLMLDLPEIVVGTELHSGS